MIRAQRQDSFRRIQIGVGGIAAVLLLVGLAGIAQDRAVAEAPVAGTLDTSDATASADGPQEPLAELGVTPSGDTKGKSAKPAPAGSH